MSHPKTTIALGAILEHWFWQRQFGEDDAWLKEILVRCGVLDPLPSQQCPMCPCRFSTGLLDDERETFCCRVDTVGARALIAYAQHLRQPVVFSKADTDGEIEHKFTAHGLAMLAEDPERTSIPAPEWVIKHTLERMNRNMAAPIYGSTRLMFRGVPVVPV